jgi:membrane-bound serine protease (ClpP class)
MQHQLADLRANHLEAVLTVLDLVGAEVRPASQTWAETLVRFLTHPVITSLLMTLGILGIIVELRMPGFGVPGAVGIASLALFFWGHWLVRLAGWEELLLVGIGLVFMALEVFVIPGFGVTGILGIAALLSGLGLSVVGAGATWSVILTAMGGVALSLLLAIAASLVLLRFVSHLPFSRRLVLEKELPADEGITSAPGSDQRWLGVQGTAASPLHPAGVAHLDHERVDVVSDGEFIEAGEPIEVIRVDGNRIVVCRARTTHAKE